MKDDGVGAKWQIFVEMTPGFEIETMTPDDVPAVAELERQTFSSPWPLESFLFALENTRIFARVARREEAVVGYVLAVVQNECVLVANLAVAEAFRRQGLARGLLGETLDWARSCRLETALLDVRESNLQAIRLYRSFGFEGVGKKLRYYSDPVEDALVMRLGL